MLISTPSSIKDTRTEDRCGKKEANRMEAHKKKMLERKLRELMRQADLAPAAASARLNAKPIVTRVIRRRKGTPGRAPS